MNIVVNGLVYRVETEAELLAWLTQRLVQTGAVLLPVEVVA